MLGMYIKQSAFYDKNMNTAKMVKETMLWSYLLIHIYSSGGMLSGV